MLSDPSLLSLVSNEVKLKKLIS